MLKEVKQAANFVSTNLETVVEKLPSWNDTVTLMSRISLLSDMVIYVAFKDLKDAMIQKVVDAFKDKFGDILTSIEYY